MMGSTAGMGGTMSGPGMAGFDARIGLSKAAIKEKHPKIHPPPKHPRLHPRGPLCAKKTTGDVVSNKCGEVTSHFAHLEQASKDLECQLQLDRKSLNEMNRNIETMQLETDRLKRDIDFEQKIV